METVGAYEAKTHLAELLERVARGARITVTKHGVVVPPDAGSKRDPKQVIEAIKASRKGRTLGKVSLRTLIEEGRRH